MPVPDSQWIRCRKAMNVRFPDYVNIRANCLKYIELL